MSVQMIASNTSMDEIVAFLVENFKSHVNETPEAWSASTKIDSVGIDSFDSVEILFKIEDQYGVDLEYNANVKFTDLTTIEDLARHISKATALKTAA